jgi:hypothetical protein
MFEEREVITWLLAIGVMVFALLQREALRHVQNWRVLLASFGLLFASLTLSVVEEVGWNTALNVLQHVCSALGAILLAVWCWLTFAVHRKTT